MRVACVRLISPIDGKPQEDSAWVKLHEEYPVVSILAAPDRRMEVQILLDGVECLGWFDSAMFMTTDASIPSNWVSTIGEDGALSLGPARWEVGGFWESFYDGDPQARAAVAEELSIILATSGPGPEQSGSS